MRKLNAEFAKVVQAPEIKNVYENIGADPLAMSPQEFQKRTVERDREARPVVKASGAERSIEAACRSTAATTSFR